MDAGDKPGHDGEGVAATALNAPFEVSNRAVSGYLKPAP